MDDKNIKVEREKNSQGFDPSKRIKKRSQFLEIQSKGKKFKTRNFLFIIQEAEKSRLGITITTKVHKRAVQRNRVKRCLREVYRRLYAYLNGTYDVVVISHQGSIDLSYLEIKKELNYAFRKMGLL